MLKISKRKINTELKSYIVYGTIKKIKDTYIVKRGHEFGGDFRGLKRFTKEDISVAYSWVMKNMDIFMEFYDWNDMDSIYLIMKRNRIKNPARIAKLSFVVYIFG